MTIKKIMIGGFIAFALVFAALIAQFVSDDKENWTTQKSTHSKIVDIYGGDKGRLNLQIMALSDSQTLPFPKIWLVNWALATAFLKKKGNLYLAHTCSIYRRSL